LPVPLRVHGHYTRAEIEAAFGVLSTESPWIHREGVLWHQASATGQRYIHHAARGSKVLLFVREHRKQDGRPGAPTEPFVCLGFATYESHEGERPMARGNLCGGWSGRFRRRGCQAVAWHKSGVSGLRPARLVATPPRRP
jgi:hypothetical protein